MVGHSLKRKPEALPNLPDREASLQPTERPSPANHPINSPQIPIRMNGRIPPKPLPISSVPLQDQIRNFKWRMPDLRKPNVFWKARSTLTLFLVGIWGKSVLSIMNRVRIVNKDRMVNAIFNRPDDTSLVTLSNHESCIDDPTLLAQFMNVKQFGSYQTMRWNLAAHDVCFRNQLTAEFFSLGKCVPVVRGLGVFQKGVDFAIERLNEGEWVHIFPEGRVNLEREGLYRLKWGIGRILTETKKTPLIIPFWHTGMSNILANDPPFIPKWGHEVLVNVGEPIVLSGILESLKWKTAKERRKEVTDFVQTKLVLLGEETMQLASKLKT